jgi:predicted lipid-binding transport protein (Tim44 family)
MSRSRLTVATLGLAAGLAIIAADVANARAGGGRSYGSRGTKSYTPPPATNTAPKAAPVERSMAQKAPAATQSAQPAGAAASAAQSRFGGWRGLLMGGLIAAGLASIFGFGALASVLGFLLQFALIAGIVYLVVMFFRSRSQPALARATAGRAGSVPDSNVLNRQGYAGGGGSNALFSVGQEDLDTFERLLGEIQTAYGRADTDKLGTVTTPEMLSYFSQDLADDARQGLRNEVSDVKLLQGDVSEAWRENGSDYATVAMRYSLIDATLDKATGRVVSGDRTQPTEATELWTFRRDDRAPGDGWQLSAIQQAA